MNRLRRLFHSHRFEPFELQMSDEPLTYVEPRAPVTVWYVGYRCTKCGEQGYKVPLAETR